ncbi:hypothetical protein EYC59_04580 [Candidatus Saccharibacteria bacterium]|nr:MAG: hypothetical protein EYC59_04580 [Candidatus Saccharibacteria bacterium]
MSYQKFRFVNYAFDTESKVLSLDYAYDDAWQFRETYKFDFDFTAFDPQVLDRAIQNLFFMAGVSYYKAFLAPEISVEKGQLDAASADFFGRTYQRGLGELFFVNKLNPRTPVNFPATTEPLPTVETAGSGLLVGIGGGKDSLVSVELLRNSGLNIATWSLDHKTQLSSLIERVGLPHYWVEREWDKQLLELKNNPDAYNGHVPISAIFACVGTIVAILSGRKDNIVSNEQSANEPTLTYDGVDINHQYSKSQDFERAYQQLVMQQFGDSTRYYSLLRPLSELRIAELFSKIGFEKYHDVFSSCNRAFTHDSDHMFWDGICPKCAFVYLALTPFVPAEQIQALFDGKNLLLDAGLEPTYRQLLGIEGDKPLECVGEVKESRAAMREAQKTHPELAKYTFEIPADYDFRAIATHEMPPEIWQIVQPLVS